MKKKLNILIPCGFFKDDEDNPASFRVRYLTALAMSVKGHDVVFMYPESRFKYLKSSVQDGNKYKAMMVIGIPGILPKRFRRTGYDFIECLFKTIYVMTHQVDIIQVTGGHRPINFVPCLFGKHLKGCVIVDESWEWLGKGGYADKRKGLFGKLISLYDKCFEIRVKELYDNIIVISSELKRRFRNPDKVIVLYGGAENNNLHPYELDEARDLICQPTNRFIIGMSNLTRGDHEDNRIFFEAFRKLCGEYSNVYLIATGCDRSYVEKIKKEYGITDRIISPGYIEFDEYNKYLSACNVFVLPYLDTQVNRARWPNKLGDYICLERPVITNPVGDVETLFTKYKVGILCNETSESFYVILKDIVENRLKIETYTQDSQFVAKNILSFDKRIDRMLKMFTVALKARKSEVRKQLDEPSES